MTSIRIRQMNPADYDEVARLAKPLFQDPPTASDIGEFLQERANFGIVAVLPGVALVGAALYEMHKDSIELHDIFVDTQYQRQGVASGLIEALKKKCLKGSKQLSLESLVPDDMPATHLLLKQLGLRACAVIHGIPCGPDMEEQDCYWFQWDPPTFNNRISKYFL